MTTEELLVAFREEVHTLFDTDPSGAENYIESDFHSLTAGWAIAKGLSLEDAFNFATHVRYETDMA